MDLLHTSEYGISEYPRGHGGHGIFFRFENPRRTAMFQPLETEDAAIPFDRVPYVPADLRRVAITAGLMIVLILIAAVVVTHVVQ